MAKLFVKFSYAKLKNVEANKKTQTEEWEWQKNFIGEFGTLYIFESEHKHLGEKFAYLDCADGSWLRTGCGNFSVDNNELTITTNKNIYVFEIHREEARLWADEKTGREQ